MEYVTSPPLGGGRVGLLLKHLLPHRYLYTYPVLPWGYGARIAIGIGAVRIVALIKVQQYLIVFYVVYGQVYITPACKGGLIISLISKWNEEVILIGRILHQVQSLVYMQRQHRIMYAEGEYTILAVRFFLAAVRFYHKRYTTRRLLKISPHAVALVRGKESYATHLIRLHRCPLIFQQFLYIVLPEGRNAIRIALRPHIAGADYEKEYDQ